jgi:hypothetical protein
MAKSLEDLAREAGRLQLEHRLPRKAQGLLNLLSGATSDERREDSTTYDRRLRDMIDRIRSDHPEWTEDEIRQELELAGF